MVSAAIGKKIEKLWSTGLSQRKIAKKLKIAQSTVSDYLSSIDQSKTKKAQPSGKKTDQSKTKKANLARIEYCSEKRIELIDRGMAHLEDMLPGIDKPSGMRDWFISLGTAIDKRRLEEPKGSQAESDLLDKFVSDLDDHANAILAKAGRSLPQSSEDPPNAPLRIGEERKD
jgi:predicted transcriptional regulator